MGHERRPINKKAYKKGKFIKRKVYEKKKIHTKSPWKKKHYEKIL